MWVQQDNIHSPEDPVTGHERDAFRGNMMFRGPSIQFSGTQSPFYTGAGTQYQRTNTGAYSYSHPFSGQSQWQGY